MLISWVAGLLRPVKLQYYLNEIRLVFFNSGGQLIKLWAHRRSKGLIGMTHLWGLCCSFHFLLFCFVFVFAVRNKSLTSTIVLFKLVVPVPILDSS